MRQPRPGVQLALSGRSETSTFAAAALATIRSRHNVIGYPGPSNFITDFESGMIQQEMSISRALSVGGDTSDKRARKDIVLWYHSTACTSPAHWPSTPMVLYLPAFLLAWLRQRPKRKHFWNQELFSSKRSSSTDLRLQISELPDFPIYSSSNLGTRATTSNSTSTSNSTVRPPPPQLRPPGSIAPHDEPTLSTCTRSADRLPFLATKRTRVDGPYWCMRPP